MIKSEIKRNFLNPAQIIKLLKYAKKLNLKVGISFFNPEDINDFENKINKKIEHERFRGNIYIKNLNPWSEFKLINKIILINKCSFLVLSKIPRCSATNLKIDSDKSDINLPLKLMKTYGHRNLGVYLKPLNHGFIEVGDKIVF